MPLPGNLCWPVSTRLRRRLPRSSLEWTDRGRHSRDRGPHDLEFSERLRTQDTADEIGFLALECERLGAPDFARALLDAYRAASGDDVDDALVDFYQSCRAMTRARLAAWHLPRLVLAVLERPLFVRGKGDAGMRGDPFGERPARRECKNAERAGCHGGKFSRSGQGPR